MDRYTIMLGIGIGLYLLSLMERESPKIPDVGVVISYPEE